MNILHYIVDFFGIIVLFGIVAIVLVHIIVIIMIVIDELRIKKSKGVMK